MRGGRCAAPTPKLSSALIDAQADPRGWSNADPPDAGQGALAMPLRAGGVFDYARGNDIPPPLPDDTFDQSSGMGSRLLRRFQY